MSGSGVSLARSASLLALGALAVHQLRYLLAYGPASGEALHREGHGYLAELAPLLVALAVAALVASVLGRALTAATSQGPAATPVRAAAYASSIVAVFAAQELAEGALEAGHPAGLEAVVGGGAWLAAPLALAFGAVAALAELFLNRTEVAIAAALAPGGPPVTSPAVPAVGQGDPALARPTPLAFGLARRPPPLAIRT